MTADEISRLAYTGTAPESARSHELLLWYRLRDIYQAVKDGQMTKQEGIAAKQTAINSFNSERELFERNVLLWQRIEQAALAYTKAAQHTAEADNFYYAVYGVHRKGAA